MPRAYELTWDKSLHRWVKVIRGKKYYFSGRVASKASREDYLKALDEYHLLLPEILAGKPVGSAATRLASEPKGKSRNPKKRVAYAVAEYHRFLDGRVSETRAPHSISPGRAAGVKNWLKPFLTFLDSEYPNRDITGIDEEVISKYWASEVSKARDISPYTTFQRFAILKNFLRFCWKRRLIDELPRNLSDLKFGVPAESEILYFDWRKSKGEEVQKIIKACREQQDNEFLYLCVLLGLNCGFTLKDINDLKTSDFRWKTKSWPRIERNRSKSGQYGNFVLWQETVRLLKKHMNKKADYNSNAPLLLMHDGRPIMNQEGGQFDSPIAYQFKKIVTKTFPPNEGKKDRRSFKTLRKTGANYCVRRERGTEILYLAHKPKTMAARFYAKTPPDSLDRVLCWMEEDFGLVETLVKRYRTTDEQERSRRKMDDDSHDE
jgi:integrase